MTSIYDYEVTTMGGATKPLKEYQGKVLLIVNTASKCGFTPQFEGLEKLYADYKDKGLEILGFPCNQFGKQDPGNDNEIQEFCQLNYGVSFPMHSKIDVNGDNTDPLYKFLKAAAPGLLGSEKIKWNFTKFLVNKNGDVIERFASATKPEKMQGAIVKALAE
jgi:glutathione peroxidase